MKVSDLEQQKQELKDNLQLILDNLAGVKDRLVETLPQTEYEKLEKQRRKLGRDYQKTASEISWVNKEIKLLNRKNDLEDNERLKERAAYLAKQHLQWEAFFVEAAREYLSGHEFEVIAKRASSKQQIRNM